MLEVAYFACCPIFRTVTTLACVAPATDVVLKGGGVSHVIGFLNREHLLLSVWLKYIV